MPWTHALSRNWKLAALGLAAVVLGLALLDPRWIAWTVRATLDGFLELFVAGWMC